MGRFFAGFQLDRLSFWIGFLAATLFWWLLIRFRPNLSRLWNNLLARIREYRESRRATTEFHHRNDTIRYAQSLHIAASLFSLDEILIPPLLLAPPVSTQPGETPAAIDITDLVIPYMPDWPYLAATYNAPHLTIEESLEENANLLILGDPGSGKTVALAYLATQVARKESTQKLNQRVPILIHAAHLINPGEIETESLLQPVIDGVRQNAGKQSKDQLSQFLHLSFETGRVLMLIDGVDELPPFQIDQIGDYVSQLIDSYPSTQFVVTASWEFIDGFTRKGFFPVALSPWRKQQQGDLIERWSEVWIKYIEAHYSDDREMVDPLLINAWLRDDERPFTPLEFTLKVWAAYAGDLIGPSALDAIEAYLLRMSADIPDVLYELKQLAARMVISQRPVIHGDKLQRGKQQSETIDKDIEESVQTDQEVLTEDGNHEPGIHHELGIEEISFRNLLPDLEQNSLIRKHSDGMYQLVHPALMAYLASESEIINDNLRELQNQSDWIGKTQTLAYLSAQMDASPIVESILGEDKTPLHWELFSVARWLRHAENKANWHNMVLRALAASLQKEDAPLALRARAITALALTADISGADVLLRKLLDSPDSRLSQLAILGCGHTRDTKAVTKIRESLTDPQPNVRRAACLALVAIGDRNALEAVAEALLHGDEETRRAAAEAFANHPEEGYPTLQDAMGMDDFMVRRAAIFGLQRVAEPWVIDLLERIQVEDEQWMVKDAASLSIQILTAPNPRVPKPHPPMTETPWLLAFAGELGVGVAPGKASEDLLFRALRDGNDEQKLAALETIWYTSSKNAVLPVYHQYFSNTDDIREMSYLTLYILKASGIDLPQPAQFGLGTPQ